MTTDNKTLADVQPGGMVRLGDQAERARFEGWAEGNNYKIDWNGLRYIEEATQDAWIAWQGAISAQPKYITGAYELGLRDGQALSAQPSPGGQDAPERCAECRHTTFEVHPDGHICVHCKLIVAARQPVGEPVAVVVPGAPTSCKHCGGHELQWFAHVRTLNDVQQGRLNTHDVGCMFVLGCEECSETLRVVKADDIAALLNAAPPVHAQDLGQIWQQAFYDTAHSYRRNKSRMWVLQMMKERVQALIDSQAVGK